MRWQIRFYREVGYNNSQIRSAISEHVHKRGIIEEGGIKSGEVFAI